MEATQQAKVLIGVITYDSDWYCLKDFADSLAKLYTFNLDVEIMIVDNSDTLDYMKHLEKFIPKAELIHYDPPADKKGFHRFRHCELKCRQIIVDNFKHGDYTHLFFLDSDVICEPDVLLKLVEQKKDIVCGLFRYRVPPDGRPLWFHVKKPIQVSPKTGVWIMDFVSNKLVENRKELLEIDACGFGAILIKKHVLDGIKLKKSPNDHYGADIHFCFDAKQKGFRIYGDPSAKCEHLYKQCARRKDSNAKAF